MEATMSATSKVAMRKKKTRMFETYMLKIIKKISETNGITNNAKQQLNSIVSSLAKLIADTAINLTQISKKKTMSEKEVTNAVKIILPNDFSKNIMIISENSIQKYNSAENVKSSRQEKAGIIFPPSLTEKYLRGFGNSKLMVTESAPLYLAIALEYLTEEVLKNAVEYIKDKKHIRISVRDLEMGVRTDTELHKFFTKNNITFLGGGVVPYIHPSLFVKKPRKTNKVNKSEEEKSEERKKHRFRPGTVALREIKRYQKASNCLTLAKFPFQKLVRDSVVKHVGEDSIKISKDVFIIVQYFIEQVVIDILHHANFAAIHAGRIKMMPNDITFVDFLLNKTSDNPYENSVSASNPLELEQLTEEDDEEDEEDQIEDKE
jgi:histone H3/H4